MANTKQFVYDVWDDSDEPPKTSDDEEEVESPKTKRKKERKMKRQLLKEKRNRIQNEIQLLKKRYAPPFGSIWKQLKCIKFDENGNFAVNEQILSRDILEPYVVVSHIRDFKYSIKYQLRTSFNTAIGYSTKKRLSYGTASEIKPKYSYVLNEEVTVLQQDICVDMISMLYNYDELEDKENDQIKIYRWTSKDKGNDENDENDEENEENEENKQIINGPKLLAYYYERMQDNTNFTEPVTDDDSSESE